MQLGALLSNFHLEKVRLGPAWANVEISFEQIDQDAAWELYIEMLLRVVTQPLPSEGGDESTALHSIYALFPVTREILRRRGRSAISFSKVAIPVMNQVVRPFTTKWHPQSLAGALSDDEKRTESGKTWRRCKATCATTIDCWLRSPGWKTRPTLKCERMLAMPQTKRHKAFISYHHGLDEEWKDRFVRLMGSRIIDKSIYVGEIVDTNSPTADTLRRIREEYISEATVAVVLVGPRTWQRKFVDWEIGAALRDTEMNPRCGLIGILLPTHPDFGKTTYNPRLMPPRLADNCSGDHPFAKIVDWRGPGGANDIQVHIHNAFQRRRKQPDPDNSRLPFGRNWNRPTNEGWQT